VAALTAAGAAADSAPFSAGAATGLNDALLITLLASLTHGTDALTSLTIKLADASLLPRATESHGMGHGHGHGHGGRGGMMGGLMMDMPMPRTSSGGRGPAAASGGYRATGGSGGRAGRPGGRS